MDKSKFISVVHGAGRITYYGTKVNSFELEKAGYKFVHPYEFQYLGSFCGIIKNKNDEIHVYHSYAAGAGAVDFDNEGSYDQGAIKKFLSLGKCFTDDDRHNVFIAKQAVIKAQVMEIQNKYYKEI